MTTTQSLPIYITDEDKNRLRKMLNDIKRDPARRDDLTSLSTELARARTVDSDQMPPNVVTMNSRVSIIDQDTSEEMQFTLVFPENADVANNRISVLSPIGTALLGFKIGDEFEWTVPAGVRKYVIAKVDH